ncbi:MAG: hypothetical protein HQ490_01855 [Lutibacter sp.]|nr:hypothetical protein [Lutibacter sp.]
MLVSKDFIKSKHNQANLEEACRQQKQLSYFTQSKVQKDITVEYLEQWANRKYRGDDYFLNWVKTILKTDNFLLIFKYLRFPIPSASLINDKVRSQLRRVFYSEDSYFRYEINGELIKHPKELEIDDFNETLFNALLFRHNDILITDLKDVNEPYRFLVDIEDVVSIETDGSIIKKIAYSAEINDDTLEEQKGIVYIDEERYLFYGKDNLDKELLNIPHDLGKCPADFVSLESFGDDSVVRKSIFSYTREKMENYVFLSTLQNMAIASGVIPTVTMLDVPIEGADNDGKGSSDLEPMSLKQLGSQRATQTSTVSSGNSIMQSGNLIKVPLIRKEDGSVEMDVVKNYLNFFYVPIEALEYLNKRVKEVEVDIVSSIIGDHSESLTPQGSKSPTEINGVTIVSKQDKLREFSKQLSRIRERSDFNFLALKYGKDRVKNEAFYGSDFFLEAQDTIYKLISLAPNPIEQKSLLIKSARNRNRFNENNFTKEYILYQLLPYSTKEDFALALTNDKVGDITFQYQTRFNHWVNIFEYQYGDMLTFWNGLDANESEKIGIINNLILIIIRDNYEKSSMVKDLQG